MKLDAEIDSGESLDRRVLVVAALVVGWLLPEKHTASRQATFRRRLKQCGRSLPMSRRFRRGAATSRRVERLPDRDGRPVWVEEGGNGRMTFAVERSEAPRLLVVRIADPDLPFGGTWTYAVLRQRRAAAR